MKKTLFFIFMILISSSKYSIATLPPPVSGKDFIKDELLIRFKKKVEKKKIEEIFKTFRLKEIRYVKSIKLYHVKILDGKAVLELIKKLSIIPEVSYAEPNYIRHINAMPNDPDYSKQWGKTAQKLRRLTK